MLDSLKAIFSIEAFVPHGHCYLWKAELVGLHVTADALIALAYYSIPIALVYFVRRRQDLPFKWIFLLFGAFIISCGTTHLLEIWTLWYPTYWLSGGMKAITALISVVTAIELVPAIPKVIALPKPNELQRLNEELQISQARFAGIVDIASDAIISIDTRQRITLFNRAAERVFGYTAAEVLGQPLDLLLPERFTNLHQQHVSSFQNQNGDTRRMGDRSEIFGRRKDGSEFPAEASISKLEIAGEKILTAFLRNISDRKQAEAELQAQKQFLRQVIDTDPNLIFVKDWEGKFTLANQAVAEIYNTTVEELIGKTDADFSLNATEVEKYQQADRQVMQTLQPLVNLQESVTTSLGCIRYFQATKKPLISADGKTRYVLGVANDVTNLKQTEAALQQKTEELETFFASTIDLLCIANKEGYFTRLNPEWERTLGYSLQELEGKSFLELVHPDDLELTLATAQLAEQQLVLSFVNRYRHRNGSYRWLEWRSIPHENRIYATARDITDRKQAEAALRLSQERLQLALEASSEGLWDWQIDTGEVYRSSAYLEILGYDAESFPHDVTAWEQLIHPNDRDRVFDCLNAHLRDTSVQFVCEYRMQTKSGEWKWIADYGKVVAYDIHGKPLRMIGTHKDISDRKQAEATLRLTDFSFESSSASAVWIKPDASLMRVNAAACQTLGYSREELQSMHVYDLDPNFPIEAWPEHWQALKQHKHLKFATQLRTKAGILLPVEVTLNYVEFDGEEYNFASMQDISDRLQAEAFLRDSEARYRAIVEDQTELIARIQADGKVTFVNEAFCRYFNQKRENLIGSHYEPVVYAADRKRVAHLMGLLNQENPLVVIENRVLVGEEIRWTQWVNRALFDEQGNLIEVQAVGRDIDELKQTEAALRHSEATNRAIINAIPDYLVQLDRNGTYLEVIKKGEIQLIHPEKSVPGASVSEILPPDKAEERMGHIQRALASHQVQIYEYELEIAGKTHYEEARISPITNDTALLMVRDITQRKQAEVDLKASEFKFRAIFATMFQFIGLLTPDGILLEANQAALDFGGLTLEDVRNRPFWEARWWAISEKTQVQLKAAIAQAAAGEFVRYEVDVLGVGGTVATIDFSLKPIKDETGKVILLIPEGRDISDRKQAEAQIQASLKEKEILLKEIHHRVKNNLQIIYSLLRLQRRTLKDPKAVQSLLDSQGRIESIALVHEKLYRAGNLATVDFAEYIPGLVANLLSSYDTQSKPIALETAIDPITLDIDKAVPCGLIINELISNSLKYAFPTQETGRIQVAMYTDEVAKITLLVKDDGVGLPPEFDLAQTNSLGLQLVQDFVDQLKGTIQISCSQGTEFSITFSANPS